VKHNNPSAHAKQSTSPISEIEPLLLQLILLLVEPGNPLTNDVITELANEILEDTSLSKKMCEIKIKRK
jgi:hypothetical protein